MGWQELAVVSVWASASAGQRVSAWPWLWSVLSPCRRRLG